MPKAQDIIEDLQGGIDKINHVVSLVPTYTGLASGLLGGLSFLIGKLQGGDPEHNYTQAEIDALSAGYEAQQTINDEEFAKRGSASPEE